MERGAVIIEGSVLREYASEGVVIIWKELAFLETDNVIFG